MPRYRDLLPAAGRGKYLPLTGSAAFRRAFLMRRPARQGHFPAAAVAPTARADKTRAAAEFSSDGYPADRAPVARRPPPSPPADRSGGQPVQAAADDRYPSACVWPGAHCPALRPLCREPRAAGRQWRAPDRPAATRAPLRAAFSACERRGRRWGPVRWRQTR